jgi:TonB family protein
MKEVKSKEQAEELPLQITTPEESRAATPKVAVPAKSNPHVRPSNAETSKTPAVMRPSDDPVLAELERSELEEDTKQLATEKAQAETSSASERNKGNRERECGSDLQPPPIQPKRNGMLAGTLMLSLAGGGLYAAWNYQPDFRVMAQAQINHLLSSIGAAHASVATPTLEKLQAIPIAKPANTEVRANNGSNQTATITQVEGAPNPAVSAAGLSNGDAASNGDKTAVPRPVEKQGLEKPSSDPKFVESKFSATPGSLKTQGASDETESAVSNNSDAVILSSQGAQKRLSFSVQPKYPVEQSPSGAQGTIVLKTNVLANGKVGSVQLVEGNPALAKAAMDAVKQWKYRPYLRSGKAEPFQTVVIVDFQRP